MRKNIIAFLIATALLPLSSFAQQETEYYPIAFDKNTNRTNTARKLNAIGLEGNVVALNNTNKMYNDMTRHAFIAKAGQRVLPTFDFVGRWMLGYVYVDKDQNGQFDVREISVNGIPSADNDLVSFAGLTIGSAEYNSEGNAADMSQVAPPAFTIPETMASGFYMMRYKVDWDSTDPAGRMDEANGIIKNGGSIADIRLRIVDADNTTISATAHGGALKLFDGSALDGASWPYGESLSILAIPDNGYTLDHILVRHGILSGDSIINGVAQYVDEVFPKSSVTNGLLTIDGSMIDGEVVIDAVFKEDQNGGNDEQYYALVFNDEFNQEDGTLPNPDKWRCSTRYSATWNRWISDSPEVAFINNGNLVCRAIPNPDKTTDTADMLTGSIETRGLFSFTYGKVEVRLRTVPHTGSFPAAWMMPQPPSQTWPKSGEIDIFESINAQNTAFHTLHSEWIDTRGNKNNPKSSFSETVDIASWHVYSVEWEEDLIIWKVDGKNVGTYRKATNQTTLDNGQWPYEHPFYIILNQSVGDGSWAATPDLDFTYETLFDYVRVYQKVATGIRVIDNSQFAIDNDAIYDLQGRRVNGQLPRGIYIRGGKKFVVK